MATNEDKVHEVSDGEQDVDAKTKQKISQLKGLRTTTKGSISRIKTLISKKGVSLSTEELNCRLCMLDDYFKKAISVQDEIDKLSQGADAAGAEVVTAEIEDIYVTTKSKILSLLSKRKQSEPDVSIMNNTASFASIPRVRREIKLPKFEGKYCEFPKFIALFNKLIHQDECFDNCERFLILKEHLASRALSAIADFDVTDDNYPKALERLKECFDKKALMFEEHISALFAIPKSSKPSASHLRQVVDAVNAHLSAMLSLGDFKDVANAVLIHMVMEKIDVDSQVKWEESVDYSKLPSWDECSAILTRRCQNLEARESKSVQSEPQAASCDKGYSNKRGYTSLAVSKSNCYICQGSGHELQDCNKFKNMVLNDRYVAARKAKLCFRCLKRGHLNSNCTAPNCSKCNRPHHPLLHKEVATEGTVGIPNDSTATVYQNSSGHASVMSVVAEPSVFLATAIVLVKGSCTKYQRARAILDSGSQVNLMCENLAQKLLLKTRPCKLDVSGVGDVATIFKKQAVTTIKSRANEFEVSLEFYILPKITSSKPDQYIDVSHWKLPHNVELADPTFNVPSRVDILIGAEIFYDLLSVGKIFLENSLPGLQKTVLGWIVAGKTNECLVSNHRLNNLMVSSEYEDNLDNLVSKFWELEQIASKSKFLTEEEEECERNFIKTTFRDIAGRFVVKVPFKPSVKDLGSSYNAAERRLLLLEKRLSKDPLTREAYNAFMSEYLALGHMTEVKEKDISKIKYFAPHQHVLRPESTSTKLRVVFDCSCKTDNGISLNEVMMKGPQVQDDLLSIILRFRCYKYAITADVAKMYRQAWVTDDDADYQAILWRSSPENYIKVYRLQTITYGTVAAPYLATRCLKKLGEDFADEYPIGSKKILSDFYMDDLITGSNEVDEIFEIYKQVSAVLDKAKFKLRKWFSNNKDFLKAVPADDQEKTLRVNDEEIIKTLGIIWAPVGDTFRYVWPNLDESKAVTKRIVLAELSKLFDPLGLINPVIVKAKIFMQDLWILKVHWDESLPINLHSQWIGFREKLKQVENISVPRYVLAEKKFVRVEMHGFADASKRAYGCCIYIRTICEDNEVTVNLWSAKSRVAPLKTQSLPRLELLGGELLSKLVMKTKANFPIGINSIYLWTDSEILLDWLKEHPSNWNTFVANRVAVIQEETKDCIWRHVPSKLNPADIISRGAYANELLESFWFTGPNFLKKSCDEWPANRPRHKTAEVNKEKIAPSTTLFINSNPDMSGSHGNCKPTFVQWMESFSDIEKLQRVIMCMLSFRKLNRTMDEALIRIVYCIQQYYFREEIALLSKNHELPASSKIKNLSPFIEYLYGIPILRVGGRLKNADLPYDSKHQILLPNKSKTVQNYVRFLHLKYFHAGSQALMAIIRQRFWIFHARNLIRSVTGSCILCFRCRPKLCKQIMGDLPQPRVAVSKPFTVTGVDFCGPVITTYKLRGCRTTKSYIAVFICFSTKAVHMEVVSDLTAKAFLASLKRFVARRGLCSKLFCDNATNFVGTRHDLEEMKEKFYHEQVQGKISKYCIANNIEFQHIPPRSPHFGGLWEAAVKSAKYHLIRILGESHLTFEELSTVVAEVEAVLNSRPLTSMSNDPNDESVLTPAHFLTGGPLIGIAEPTYDSKELSHLDRWLRVSAIQQHFWKRWSMEYLHELQQKVKWTKKERNLNEGELVLVSEDNLPPKQWLIGRVSKVVRDAKGSVRVAVVKTKNGEIKRAIYKLAPIPKDD